jgi:hypothetical protein
MLVLRTILAQMSLLFAEAARKFCTAWIIQNSVKHMKKPHVAMNLRRTLLEALQNSISIR